MVYRLMWHTQSSLFAVSPKSQADTASTSTWTDSSKTHTLGATPSANPTPELLSSMGSVSSQSSRTLPIVFVVTTSSCMMAQNPTTWSGIIWRWAVWNLHWCTRVTSQWLRLWLGILTTMSMAMWQLAVTFTGFGMTWERCLLGQLQLEIFARKASPWVLSTATLLTRIDTTAWG